MVFKLLVVTVPLALELDKANYATDDSQGISTDTGPEEVEGAVAVFQAEYVQ